MKTRNDWLGCLDGLWYKRFMMDADKNWTTFRIDKSRTDNSDSSSMTIAVFALMKCKHDPTRANCKRLPSPSVQARSRVSEKRTCIRRVPNMLLQKALLHIHTPGQTFRAGYVQLFRRTLACPRRENRETSWTPPDWRLRWQEAVLAYLPGWSRGWLRSRQRTLQ